MVENFDHLKMEMITLMGSSAHTYGNLLATGEKWLLDILKFLNFKTIQVGSEIAHRQLVRTPGNFLKKSKPMFIMRPRIDYNEDTWLKGSLLTQHFGGPMHGKTPGDTEIYPFFYDRDTHLDLQFSQTRRVMYLDVILVFDTIMQQLNVMDYLKNEFNENVPFDIETFLEAYLPRELMQVISDKSGIPIHDPDGSVLNFMQYMNDHSIFPVTYKLAGSTGKEEFYRYYKTKIFTILQNLDRDDGESIGHITTNYKITFTLKMEFWSPGMMYLFSDKLIDIPEPKIPADATLIPIWADVFEHSDLNMAPGWEVYGHGTYQLEDKNDVVDIGSLMNASLKETIAFHIKNGLPVLNFVDVKIRKQGVLLDPKKYKIDWNTQQVYFNDKNWISYTYTIVVAADIGYINDLIKELNHLE